MAGEWRTSTWGEEISLEYGKAIRDYDSARGKYRVFGSNGPIGWTSDPLAPGPGVILGRKGAYRGVEYSANPFYVIDTAYYVVPKNECDMRWLYYAIKHYKLGEIDDGSPIPSTTRAAVYIMDLDVPPLPEQRAIAHILGTLDDKIELNRRMNETLEAMARALFKSWFVDFDPVHRNMERARGHTPPKPRNPKAAATPDALTDFDALFPDAFEDSPLGPIPQGWRVRSFADTVDIIGGGTPKTSISEYWGGDIPWFSVVDAPSATDVWVIDTEKKITPEGLKGSAARLLTVGTTIISARGTIGRVALAGTPMAMNQSCYGLQRKLGKVGIFNYFVTRHLVTGLQRRAHGSVFDTITRDTLAGISITTPAPELVDIYESLANPLLSKLRANITESRTLAALRDTLLPKLISGELRVKDAEKFVEGAV